MFTLRVIARVLRAVLLVPAVLVSARVATAAGPPAKPATPFKVDAEVALASYATIVDGHLQGMARSLEVLATSEQARSADWSRIEPALASLAKLHAPALNWFALPDGSYWSVQNGREQGNLSTRAYFPKALAGRTVIGDLVVSKATAQNVVIVAVPVKLPDGKVAGVLGASIFLVKLGERIRDEMRLTSDLIFYSFDSTPLLALVWDPGLVFVSPKDLGPEVDKAFAEMLTKKEGVVRYVFREKQRTVVFRRSTLSGWWHAVGLVQARARAGL